MLRIGTIISVSNKCNVGMLCYAESHELVRAETYVVIGHYQQEYAEGSPWFYNLKNCHNDRMSSDILAEMHDIHTCIETDVISVTFYPTEDETYSKDRIAEYIQNGGIRCPMCYSTDISGDSTDDSGDHMEHEMSCHECGEQWTAVFALSTIVPRN